MGEPNPRPRDPLPFRGRVEIPARTHELLQNINPRARGIIIGTLFAIHVPTLHDGTLTTIQEAITAQQRLRDDQDKHIAPDLPRGGSLANLEALQEVTALFRSPSVADSVDGISAVMQEVISGQLPQLPDETLQRMLGDIAQEQQNRQSPSL